jgi:hypothetical protein
MTYDQYQKYLHDTSEYFNRTGQLSISKDENPYLKGEAFEELPTDVKLMMEKSILNRHLSWGKKEESKLIRGGLELIPEEYTSKKLKGQTPGTQTLVTNIMQSLSINPEVAEIRKRLKLFKPPWLDSNDPRLTYTWYEANHKAWEQFQVRMNAEKQAREVVRLKAEREKYDRTKSLLYNRAPS